MKKIIVTILFLFIIAIVILNKNNTSYRIIESGNYKIFYEEIDKEYVDIIRITVDTYYPMIISDFSMEREKVEIIVYPTEEKMKKILKEEMKENLMGMYYRGQIHILSPRYMNKDNDEVKNKEAFMKSGPLVHEMIHWAVDKKKSGKTQKWAEEGLALYFEYKYIGFECSGNSEGITKESLKANFNKIEQKNAYRKSFEIVKEMIEKYGDKKTIKILINRRA